MNFSPANSAALDPLENASRDALGALQLQRLRWSLQHAYDNVPHHHAAFAAKGVHPSDLRALSDLAHFPLMDKCTLRDNYPFGLFAVPRAQLRRLHASSGTTGKPIVVGYTQHDLAQWADVVARSLRAAGGHPGDMVHIAYGYGMFTGGLGAHYGAERLGCTVVPMSGGQTEKQVQHIMDFAPRIVMVTPSYALVLADEFARQGIAPHDIPLQIGIFGAEPWGQGMRTEIERALGLDAVDIYGLTEVMGPGVACECLRSRDGLVIWEDHFYPEIIDPETGAVLPEGSVGELVFTSLTKQAFPIVRFRTRDLTRLLPPGTRPFRRMERIRGRSDDMLIVRGVNVFPTQIEEQILRDPRLSGHYELVLTRQGHLDELEVRCELQRGQGAGLCAEQRTALGRALQDRVKAHIGVSTRATVLDCDSIARTLTGKARRVLDHRPAQR